MNFEKKYGIKEDEKIKIFHKSRIMFAIHNEELYICEKTSDSHADWFKKTGWINEEHDELMHVIIRGYVDTSGIYFYRGYDFEADDNDINIFLNKSMELKEMLNLPEDIFVYAGCIKKIGVTKFPPRKELGQIYKKK